MSESIYNLIPQDTTPQFTTITHTSKYNATVKSEVNATKEGGALFGPKGGVKPSTKKFLKKGDGNTIRMTAAAPATRKGSYQPTVLAPSVSARTAKSVQQYVPRHTEKATLAPRSSKEFVKTNRMEAVGTTARRVPSAYIDKVSGSGGRFGKGESGLKPKYVKTAKYGKTPKYLTQRKQELEATKQAQTEAAQSSTNNSGLHQITPDERGAILDGLRANWESMHRDYQGLSMFTDTIPKKTQRNKMEAQLNQLEADINKLERHKTIFVDTRG